jgi:hypothetical protein
MKEDREHKEGDTIFGLIQLGLTLYFLFLAVKFFFFM